MRLSLLVCACCLARLTPAQQQGCFVPEGSEIRGKDLAAALPAFHGLPEDLILGNLPLPGSKRIFHSAELAALASRHSIPLDTPGEICFAWPMEPLNPERVLAVMRTSLSRADIHIELIEASSYPVPQGVLEFPLSALGKPASPDGAGPVLWGGSVRYGTGLRYAVWAHVRITAPCNRTTAVENLKPGIPIQSRQLAVHPAHCFPDFDRSALPDQFVGMVARHPIPAGAEVRASLVAPPNDVNRGDVIEVEVQSGAARLVLKAKAEASGRSGDLISVRNPSSNRIFQARISGKDRAVVLADFEKDR